MKRKTKKIDQVLNAWETLAPNQTFAGMTVADYKARVQAITDLQKSQIALVDQTVEGARRLQDQVQATMQAALHVVNAIKGDAAHGDNSPLYAAMGYVRKSERRSGLKRGSKITALQQTLKAAA